jgi:hypothetical protein
MSEAAILFRARRLGEPVTVTTATDTDLSRLAGAVDSATDMLEFWTLLAIRSSSETVVHVVGWRMLLAQPWISHALVAYDKALGAIRTSSGDQYSLGLPGLGELDPELRALIANTLRGWGFKYVRAVAPKTTTSRRGRKRRAARPGS